MGEERPLQIVGAVHAYAAMLAERAGFKALYTSGAGVANASFGLPDLGLTSLADVAEDVRRLSSVTELPILVDADTGWGSALMIARTVRELTRAGAAGCHIEDQVQMKRCGHRPGKAIVPAEEMVDRLKSAADGRVDEQFVLVARTDALASEGIEAAVDRGERYAEAGADVVFAEAATELSQYEAFVQGVGVPILANITEFGRTPLFTTEDLKKAGVGCVLYPLSAFRAMNKAAEVVYSAIRSEGSQQSVVDQMQSREELYDVLRYHEFEQKINELFSKDAT